MLRSRAGWTRHPAVEELADLDFEQLDRPPQLALLVAALNAPELRGRARDSLARVLRGLDDEQLEQIGREGRRQLRASIKPCKPHVHAEFLVEVARALLRLEDVAAVPDLDRLVVDSTIGMVRIRGG
jgi:hypothetical protein